MNILKTVGESRTFPPPGIPSLFNSYPNGFLQNLPRFDPPSSMPGLPGGLVGSPLLSGLENGEPEDGEPEDVKVSLDTPQSPVGIQESGIDTDISRYTLVLHPKYS